MGGWEVWVGCARVTLTNERREVDRVKLGFS